jgi:hypothetical protein
MMIQSSQYSLTAWEDLLNLNLNSIIMSDLDQSQVRADNRIPNFRGGDMGVWQGA